MTSPWNRPREGPPLACHPSRCPVCGHVLSIEVHHGVTVDYCHGCARNRARADMGLAPLNFTPAVSYVPVPARRNGQFPGKPQRRPAQKPGPRPRPDRGIQRVAAKLPRYPYTACTAREIAHAIGVSEQAVGVCLLKLEKAGKAARIRMSAGRHSGFLWYRARAA